MVSTDIRHLRPGIDGIGAGTRPEVTRRLAGAGSCVPQLASGWDPSSPDKEVADFLGRKAGRGVPVTPSNRRRCQHAVQHRFFRGLYRRFEERVEA